MSGVGAGITEIRAQELFNYALYDQPDVVREVIGFGGSMDELPLMLLDFSLQMVWAPMLRILADLLEVEVDEITTHVERRPLERTIEVPGMGTFEAGTQGAFRFEVRAIVGGRPLLVVEHVTRIDDDCAPGLAAIGVTRWGAPRAHDRPSRTCRSRSTAPSPGSPARRAAGTPPRRTGS